MEKAYLKDTNAINNLRTSFFQFAETAQKTTNMVSVQVDNEINELQFKVDVLQQKMVQAEQEYNQASDALDYCRNQTPCTDENDNWHYPDCSAEQSRYYNAKNIYFEAKNIFEKANNILWELKDYIRNYLQPSIADLQQNAQNAEKGATGLSNVLNSIHNYNTDGDTTGFENSNTYKEVIKQNLNNEINNYFDKIFKNNKIPEELKQNWVKKTKEESVVKRKFFEKNKKKLRKKWAEKNNSKWPTYKKDLLNKNKVILRKKGDRYDMHHIKPIQFGGENKIENMIPLHMKDHIIIHSGNGYLNKIEKLLK